MKNIRKPKHTAPKTPPKTNAVPEIEVTADYRQILDWLHDETPVVFVTGKAGTGKTTLIRFLMSHYHGNAVVVAPTGVAALNVGGATIHSLFRLPPRVVTLDDIRMVHGRELYKNIDLLIIDEVSMVRAEIIDAIDLFLRLNRENNAPFGGVQLLLVGDLFQLPPVVPRAEREALLQMGYESPYFFSANAFKNNALVTKELTKIYRQTEATYINLLNQVRVAEDIEDILPALNERCGAAGSEENTIITLAATNAVADAINDHALGKLISPSHAYEGEMTGRFSIDDKKLPSPLSLSLKVGAQVMFTKNDDKKRWVNGTLGRVVELTDHVVCVEVNEGAGKEVYDVKPVVWETYKYEFDEADRRVKPSATGTYRQYPLMLAWAVTIHKSQGKTLEKVRVDLGSGAFDYGQVYVALSRCRSLEDVYLTRPIRYTDIKCDPVIQRFYEML